MNDGSRLDSTVMFAGHAALAVVPRENLSAFDGERLSIEITDLKDDPPNSARKASCASCKSPTASPKDSTGPANWA